MGREFLSGNEAVARGAWEAGAVVGTGYPGTPSTQTLERFAEMEGVYAEWAPNEKVALEVAAGASLAGARALVTMKHVGVNVAADPLFTLAYTGVGGGLVLLVADDPGMHSSQNEQDTRNYGPFANIPVLEPSDSQEALDFTKIAFDLSERCDLPVIVRSTTRVAHSKGLVSAGERQARDAGAYESDPAKWLMIPAAARARRVDLDKRLEEATAWAEGWDGVRVEMRDPSLGVVTSGISYQYVREALPEASVLKLGAVFPLPERAICEFASSVERLVVVEEADPYLERGLRAMRLKVDKSTLPPHGELSPGKVAAAFGSSTLEGRKAAEGLPPRPPVMCPGCPHRGVFHVLRKLRAVVTGDIGCYTMGSLPPLSAMDTCVCMGAGVGMAHGMTLVGQEGRGPVVGVIGDSTFAHSGMTALLDIAYNRGSAMTLILDNRVTAMTGHQENPCSGRTLQGRPAPELDLEALCGAMGISEVAVVDPNDLEATEVAIRAAIGTSSPSVVVAKAPCALLIKENEQPFAVDEEACTACGVCIKLGCPAIGTLPSGEASVDVALCAGCKLCVQVCHYDAIVLTGPACDIGSPR